MADSEYPETLLPRTPSLPPLLRLAHRLEQAWQASAPGAPPPDLLSFLPPPGDSHRLAALQELVRVDLSMRWQRGIPIVLESYLQRFPELGRADSLPAELICYEYQVRWQNGDRPFLADYQQRFPSQYPSLLRISEGEAGQVGASAGRPEPAADAMPTNKTIPPDAADSLVWKSQSLPQEAAAPPEASNEPGLILPAPLASAGDPKNVVPLGGGYRMLKRLSKEGAQGEVWLAEAPGGVEVAIKRLFKTLEAKEAQDELRALEHVKKLRHTHLIAIHAFGIHKGRLHIAMELADGNLSGRAKHYQKQGLPGIPQEELLRYLREAAAALDYLHAQKVLHRDIKPANILLLNGSVKVADFGLVRKMEAQDSLINATFCGTLLFMPPEVWRSKISIHSDQWSLAITYLELRLNRSVFKSRSPHELMLEILEGKLELAPLEPAEQKVLRKALHPDARQRYANCTAFAQALDAVFHPPPAPPPRRWLSMALTLFTCLVAGVLLFYLLYKDRFLAPPPASPYLPPDCEAMDTETDNDDGGKEYYKRIRFPLNEKIALEFVLIPKKKEHWISEDTNLPTFYISRFKISREQFRWFAEQNPKTVTNDKWMSAHGEDGDRMPVRDVTAIDADAFAERLGGQLPTRDQWDKAAGRYHPSRGDDPYWEGPYRGRWNHKAPLRIAVGLENPLSIGSSTTEDDESVYGCRDMAGNGSEWTRKTEEGKPVRQAKGSGVKERDIPLRGWSFNRKVPLSFQRLERNRWPNGLRSLEDPSPDLGFRVVLEPDR